MVSVDLARRPAIRIEDVPKNAVGAAKRILGTIQPTDHHSVFQSKIMAALNIIIPFMDPKTPFSVFVNFMRDSRVNISDRTLRNLLQEKFKVKGKRGGGQKRKISSDYGLILAALRRGEMDKETLAAILGDNSYRLTAVLRAMEQNPPPGIPMETVKEIRQKHLPRGNSRRRH